MKHKLLLTTLLILFSVILLANDTLNPCVRGEAFHIVVLGSSTAAGSGPSSPDSTWVNRYRKFLQQINPGNTVTNLAQGGTTTYQIMPDWFVAPAGRPATNTTRNVSEAIRLNADAIIVNMPSNDAALGFTVSEHLYNFRMIAAVADSAGIPVWVCTTQPRNFNAAKIQLQQDVRDSILTIFGKKAIDFWTTMANSAGTIDSLYDSGDGVHLNDAAHRILFQRVQGHNILSALIDTTAIEDHFVFNMEAQSGICGSLHDSIAIQISNRGAASLYNIAVEWRITDINSQAVTWRYDTIKGGVGSCALRQMRTWLNTSAGGTWQVAVKLLTQNDTAIGNDSAFMYITTTGVPAIAAQNDTTCKNQHTVLWANGADTTLWYNLQGHLLGFGDSLKISGLSHTQQYRASMIKGPLFFKEVLTAATTSSINFKGIMFDLVATDTLVIDSLTLKVQTRGRQEVTAYFKPGSHKGFEGDAQAWTLWGKDSVDVTQASSWVQVQYAAKRLLPNDTLGVYITMAAGGQLEYLWSSNETRYNDGRLSIITGSGIAQNFGTAYYPRLWNGAVHYHHGFNPTGYCTHDTVISVVVQTHQIQLGADTALLPSQFINLDIGTGFSNIQWSTGDTSATLTLDTATLGGVGTYNVWVQAIDKFGCVAYDTIVLTFTPKVGLMGGVVPAGLQVYPNPAKGAITLLWDSPKAETVEVHNSKGQLVQQIYMRKGSSRHQLQLPAGLYFIYPDKVKATPPVKLVVQ